MDQAAEVKEKTDIIKIISETVTLKKAGRNYKGLCPFHGEKTPSFMVNPELQIYKCFGCGEAGDVYTFLQKQHGMDFYEALKYLADKVGVKLKTTSSEVRGERAEIFEINLQAANLYHFLLTKHKFGKDGRVYLLKKRGLEKETVNTFKLGFAPDKPTILFDYLTKKKNFSPEKVIEAGVTIKTQRGYMDRFRGRAIFPIFDPQGRVVALAGRVLPQFDRGFGKYINSPETAIYHKSSSLYGLFQTKNAIRKTGFAVVVEGELDLLSPWQAGVGNIVASKGTALTAEQMKLLARYTKSVVLALDSDFAGDNAAVKAVSQAQEAGLEVKVALMGKYKDPDEFVKADSKGFAHAVIKAVDVWQFVIDYIFDKYDVDSATDKAKISSEIIPVLSSIEDSIVQAHYVKLVAQRLMVPVESVAQELAKHKQAYNSTASQALSQLSPKEEKGRGQILAERIVGLSLQHSPERLIKDDLMGEFNTSLTKKIAEKIREYLKTQKGEFELAKFIDFLPIEMRDGTTEIIMAEGVEEENTDKELEKLVIQLKIYNLKEAMEKQSRLIAKYEVEKNKEESKQAQTKLTKLVNSLAELTRA